MIALVGNPNAGKSALFNALTGARQKVGNYPGVTVERKTGRLALPDGRPLELIDLPGTYSLDPASPDEAVTRDVIFGSLKGERRPSALLVVVDATNLDNHLRFTLQLTQLGLPVVVALNMIDMAERDGLTIDIDALSRELGVPVIPTVAVRRRGIDALIEALSRVSAAGNPARPVDPTQLDFTGTQRRARAIAAAVTRQEHTARRISDRIDRIVLNPVLGPIILITLMFLMFQAVFAWADAPIGWIESLFMTMQSWVTDTLPDGFLRGLLVEGVIGGVGAVVVFLPQILILFFFILMLEASGYMVRAAFLMDRLMAKVGLSGKAFIPLLSSFACAIPGIMAARTVDNAHDRLTTILIAPLMTCSARLPVYTVIIAAFIPGHDVLPGIGLQGLVLFALYIAGIVGALVVALVLRRTVARGASHGFLMEMPHYQTPLVRDVLVGVWQRAMAFLKRAGTIILASTVVLWLLLTFPQPPKDATLPAIEYSAAGRVAGVIEPLVRPIGFNRDIALSLIPAMAAREVAVAALGTVYAIEEADESALEKSLVDRLRGRWPLPTALAFLVWFVFAPQCISTVAVVRRETNSWRWPLFMLGYLFVLAYLAAGATFWLATALGL